MEGINQTLTWQVVADILVGLAVPLGFAGLYFIKRITVRELAFLVFGFLIGLTFELFIFIFAHGWISFIMYWPGPGFTIPICHASWDAGLFMAGFYLAAIILKRKQSAVASAFDIRELSIMVAWGAASSFAVEFTGNGIIWEYSPVEINPIFLTIGSQGYTPFIHVVWLIVPVIFYLGCLAINKKITGARN